MNVIQKALDSQYGQQTGRVPKLLLPLSMMFVALLVISNTLAPKIMSVGSLSFTVSLICFPLLYLWSDVIVEVYGYARTRIVVWMGLAAIVIMAGFYALSAILPPAPFWQGQEAWHTFFSMSPRIVLAGIIAYFAGEFSNSWVMSRMKIWSKGRNLWMRTIGSTVVGEGADSVLFYILAFGGLFAWPQVFTMIISAYIIKVAYEVLATPFTYMLVRWVKRVEGIDHYDYDLRSYNPFTFDQGYTVEKDGEAVELAKANR